MESPVVVIGARPQGFAADAHLFGCGLQPVIPNTGTCAGAAFAERGPVCLVSPWSQPVDVATGGCSGSGVFDAPAENTTKGCGVPGPQFVQLDARPVG